ncbi:MAG: transcription factor S [Candidatus Nanoarchaeia archaeon]|nr:transcription factor S [Candidatus Nanoarchaeia archaeon]MDD5740447.1 transcription factor S [Candidatus Nanoarchaeia archaeon]
MQFCPKCGCVLVEKTKNFGCARCGYKAKGKVKIETSEQIQVKPKIGVIKEKDTDVFPVTNANCPKCNNGEAYFWTSQTRAGDEAETKFFRCTKCKHTWREYR